MKYQIELRTLGFRGREKRAKLPIFYASKDQAQQQADHFNEKGHFTGFDRGSAFCTRAYVLTRIR